MTGPDFRSLIRPLIRTENKTLIDGYLRNVWKLVNTLTSSLAYTYQPDFLDEKFAFYVKAEEERLQEGLKTVRFRIDARDTLSLITGPDRIEQHLMPLMYLLLKRHFEIFRLGRNLILNEAELRDAARSMNMLFDAVTERHDDLEALFIQKRLDPVQQFKTFASELFEGWHDSSKLWTIESMRLPRWHEFQYTDEREDQKVEATEILNYPSPMDGIYAPVKDEVVQSEVPAVRKIVGRWTGFVSVDQQWPGPAPMITFCIKPSPLDPESYEANSESARGKASIFGSFAQQDGGSTTYTFTFTIASDLLISNQTWHFIGTISDDELTLSGTWGFAEDNDRSWDFVFSRLPPEIVLARPGPHEFKVNRIQALWKYALNASRNQVRVHSKSVSWSYIKRRRDTRIEYLPLAERMSVPGAELTWTWGELERIAELHQRATTADVRYYHVLSSFAKRRAAHVFEVQCDLCWRMLSRPRLMCMECVTGSTVDLCADRPECCEQVVKTRVDLSEPHQPTHDLVKLRAEIFYYRDVGRVLGMAKIALNRGRQMLARAEVKKKDDAERVEEHGVNESASEGSRKGAVRLEEGLSDPSNTQGGDGTPIPRCISCEKVVSQPCWYCIDCPEEANAFECNECEEKASEEAKGIVSNSCNGCEKATSSHWKKLAVKIDKRLLRSETGNEDDQEEEESEEEDEVGVCNHHRSDHNVVRCTEKKVSGGSKTIEERLTSFDGKLASFESQLTALTAQMDRIEKALQSGAGASAR